MRPTLSVQRALVGVVTPALRAVFVNEVDRDNYLVIFCYERKPTVEEEELASEADTEFISDFPDSQTNYSIITIPYPEKMPIKGDCVFKRYEPGLNENIQSFENEVSRPHYLKTANIYTNLLLSSNRILFEKVTPNLRGVYAGYVNNKPRLTFCYDQELSDSEEKLVSQAEIEFLFDFPSPEFHAEVTQIILPVPHKIHAEGNCVYRRYEPLPSSLIEN